MSSASYSVYEDYSATLNQTNIGHNNNKFYIIQILQSQFSSEFYCWNRWGRVGERGSDNGLEMCNDSTSAIKSFEKKFKDKTGNNWKDRENFVPKSKKYTLIETESLEEESVAVTVAGYDSKDCQPSKLDPETQDLISLCFDKDMFNSQLKKFEIDVKKMPLGKLSKTQIAKGFEVLEEIEEVLNGSKINSSKINDLSSKFYTVIPQDFGRAKPPLIDSKEKLQQKYDMLMVLSDIELAQNMSEESVKKEEIDTSKPPHPLDTNYEQLKCKLDLLDKNSEEFKVIEEYAKETKGYYPCQILNVWKVEREDEVKRFQEHDSIEHRKLLWHGTNVAVVAAILKTGLRIMPHSGGRVGKGIYFASEQGKSAGYVGTAQHRNKNIGIMFLNEVALGKEHHITRDDCSLTKPPAGFDSIVARGCTEPDPKKDTLLTIKGKKVIVPQGKPISQNISSSFSQSEYLVYKESQNHIRYLLKIAF